MAHSLPTKLIAALSIISLSFSSISCSNVANKTESGAEAQSVKQCTKYQKKLPDGRCIDTGAAPSDDFGNFLIETVGSIGLNIGANVLRKLVAFTAQKAGTAVAGSVVSRSLGAACGTNDCAFRALAVVTNSNPARIANITGLPLGRVSPTVFKEMVEEMGLRIEKETTHKTWESFFNSLKTGNHDYIVNIQFPKNLVPKGAPTGHVVLVRAKGRLIPIDASRGVNGPAVFGTNIGGENVLYPIEYIQVWQVAK